MEFFNEKEEVIDLQLTQFGRHLLSKGRFKPTFYSFFDEDILYNVEAGGGTEEQNSSHERIYKAWDGSASTDYGAPRSKPQISFSSLEKQFLNNYNKVLSGQEELGGKSQQPTAIKNYAMPQPIGTSDIRKENAPAMQASFLQGQINSSVGFLDLKEESGGKNTLKIPQLASEITLEYIETEGDDFYEIEDPSISFGVVTKQEEIMLFIKILEQNAPYQKKNFDIEIYEILEEVKGDNTIEHLRPLHFNKPLTMVDEFDFMQHTPPVIMQDNVEYYMDVLADDEVTEEICRLDPDNLKKGVFTDSKTQECVDILNQDNKKIFDIYEDEADEPGEVC